MNYEIIRMYVCAYLIVNDLESESDPCSGERSVSLIML